MPTLPGPQVAAHFRRVGFRGRALVTMVAISRSESGWDTDAIGDEHLVDDKWGPSFGLAQVRSLHAHTGTGKPRDRTRLHDPAFNARSAWIISNSGTNFRPWSDYKNGRYRTRLPEARAAVDALDSGELDAIPAAFLPPPITGNPGVPGLPELPDIPRALGSLTEPFRRIAEWITNPGNWLRVMLAWVGLALLTLALVAVFADVVMRRVVKPAVNEAADAVLPG